MKPSHTIDTLQFSKDQLEQLFQMFENWSFFVFDQLTSTNNFIKDEVLNTSLPACVVAFNQTNGRGQRGRRWISEPFKNLTFSIAIPFPANFNTSLFLLSVAEALSIVLDKYLPNNTLIKWPNDWYYGDKKLGGILCEATYLANEPKNLIIGIGINVNQSNFNELNTNATSLKLETETEVPLFAIFIDLLNALEDLLNNQRWLNVEMIESINNRLKFKGQKVQLMINENEQILATLVEVDKEGKLWIQKESEEISSFQYENIRILGPA